MATPSGGKVRSKRSHYSRKPYERPKEKSLLARVSDKVKDFITPSWLNNLWNNPNDDDGEEVSRSSTPELPQPSGSMAMGTPNFMPAAVATSTPDIGNRPPTKEALSIPGPSGMQTTPIVQSHDVVHDSARNDDDDDVVIIDQEQPSTSRGFKHTPLPFRNYANPIGTSTPNEDIQMLGGRKPVLDKDDASDTSVSTSGCSSLVPHVDKVDHREKLSKKNLDRLSEMGHSNSLAKSSLWTDMSGAGPSGLSSSRPQPSINSAKRPSFNSSYFGSPKLLGEPRPKHSSPFYPGKTQFGGSSSQRSLKRPRNSPYEVHLPVKRNIRPKPANISLQDSLGGATSSTAKKILDTLERMSTPLLDAKRIPLSPAASPYSFRPSSRLSGRSGTSRTNDPPVSDIRVARMASIAQNRQPPVAMVIDLEKEKRIAETTRPEALPTSTAVPTISTAPSFRFGAPKSASTPAVLAYGEGAPMREKTGGKMKTKTKNTLHYSSAQNAETEEVEVPDLPEVALPLSKGLPTFSFAASLTSPSESSTTKPSSQSIFAAPISTSSSSSNSKAPAKQSTAPAFQFSSPTSSTTTSSMSAAKSSQGPQFTFASPIIKQATGSSATSLKSSSTSTTFKFSNPRQTPYTTARPSANPSLGSKKPSFETPERTRRKGGDDDDDVVEVDDNGEDDEEGGIKVAKELKTGSCLEAFGILPTKNGPIPSSSTVVQAHVVKVPSKKMDNGPLSGSANPKTGTNSLQNDTSKQSNSLFDKFKPPSSSWECDMCMIFNKEDATKCVACETPKPGVSKASAMPGGHSKSAASSTKSDSKPVFNSLGSQFSRQSNEWECDACMIFNKDNVESCAACTTPRPRNSKGGAGKSAAAEQTHAATTNNAIWDKFKPAAGEWECDTCMIRNKGTILKCVACETPKPGSQPALSAPPASSFKFGSGSTPLSNGDATGAFKFGTSTSASSSTLNSNPSSSGGFKLPTGMSLGQSMNPISTSSNGTSSSTTGGFKLPSNFSLPKTTDSLSTVKASDLTSDKTDLGKSSDKTNSGDKSEAKLEVKVPTSGYKFGAKSEKSAPSGGFKFGAGSGEGLSFGQTDGGAKTDLSSSIAQKFGQGSVTVGQTLLEKEGPPPNVNIFQTKVSENEGPSAKKSISFGSAKVSEDEGPSAKKSYSFGAAAKDTNETKIDGAAAPTLKFGATTKESTLNSNTPSFQFGASANSGTAAFGNPKAGDSVSNATTENKALFSFGSGAASSGNSSSTTTSASSQPSFNFGGGSGGGNPEATTGSITSGKPSFTFGAQNATTPSQPASSGLAFGAKPQEKAATTPSTFSFGQTAAQPADKPAATPSFNFGSAPVAKAEEAAKPAAFLFGSQNQNNNQGGSSGFGFGAGMAAAATSAPAQTTPSFNFGAAAKAPASTASGGFSFGSNTTANTGFTGSSGGFGGFGSNRSSTNPSPAFGAPPTTTANQAPSSTYTFGATATTSAPSNPFGGGSATQTNATPFGGGQTANQASMFGAANQTPSTFGASGGAPAFGGGANATTNSTPAFGGIMGDANKSTPAFGASTNAAPAFGSGTTPAFGSGTANTNPGGFPFGKTAPSFQFGATNNAMPNAAPPTGGFQFTGNQQNQAPQATPAVAPQQPSGGFNFSAGQPNSFNFGGSTPQPGATAFQFQASTGTPEPQSNPFNASGTPGAQSGRRIKRAIRRKR